MAMQHGSARDDLARDVVVLVPGFLGFARFGNFYYFADRVSAVLRGALEARLGRPVPVVPCTTLPTHGLAARQRYVLAFLAELMGKVPAVERFHLVGHSTGGVDAQLLTCAPKANGVPWSAEEDVVRRLIRSVVTISAPHQGTTLAETPLAQLFATGRVSLSALASLTRLGWDALRVLPQQIEAPAALNPDWTPDIVKFVSQIFQRRKLADDLRPDAMEALRRTVQPDLPVALSSIVTAAEPRVDAERPSEPFFADLYALTASVRDATSATVERTIAVLRRRIRSEALIKSPVGLVPASIDAGLNDGIVNSARQMVNPTDPRELAAIVIADHADVLGHYDRRDALIPGRVLNAGLFHSGAGFGDDEFFALYRRIAARVVDAIGRATAPAAPLKVITSQRRRRQRSDTAD
jgi:pimeloyl-ACP methyl ester carboxylesterase